MTYSKTLSNVNNTMWSLNVLVCLGFVCLFQGSYGQCPTVCPDSWIRFQNSCYLFNDELKLDWTESVHHCMAHGAHLVTIENINENRFLKDHGHRLFKNSHDIHEMWFWIGATDDETEGVWLWYTNHQSLDATFAGWAHGQPNNVHNEDCAVMKGDSNLDWSDDSCTSVFHFICEMETTPTGPVEVIGK